MNYILTISKQTGSKWHITKKKKPIEHLNFLVYVELVFYTSFWNLWIIKSWYSSSTFRITFFCDSVVSFRNLWNANLNLNCKYDSIFYVVEQWTSNNGLCCLCIYETLWNGQWIISFVLKRIRSIDLIDWSISSFCNVRIPFLVDIWWRLQSVWKILLQGMFEVTFHSKTRLTTKVKCLSIATQKRKRQVANGEC